MSGLPFCGSFAHIFCMTSLSKVSTIAITLLLFLLISTTFPDISHYPRFQSLQTLPHFLITTVYIFVHEYPQDELLGLFILTPACSTDQHFSSLVFHTLLFFLHKDFPHLKHQILFHDVQILIKIRKFFEPPE